MGLTNVKQFLKNEEGITLVELLASLALLSVVIILIGSVHIFGQRQFTSQAEANSQANDLRYSLAMISREARSADTFTVEEEASEIIIDANRYYLDNTNLKKNNTTLSSRVKIFNVTLEGSNRIKIRIESTPNQLNQSEVYETTIYTRTASNGGDTDD